MSSSDSLNTLYSNIIEHNQHITISLLNFNRLTVWDYVKYIRYIQKYIEFIKNQKFTEPFDRINSQCKTICHQITAFLQKRYDYESKIEEIKKHTDLSIDSLINVIVKVFKIDDNQFRKILEKFISKIPLKTISVCGNKCTEVYDFTQLDFKNLTDTIIKYMSSAELLNNNDVSEITVNIKKLWADIYTFIITTNKTCSETIINMLVDDTFNLENKQEFVDITLMRLRFMQFGYIYPIISNLQGYKLTKNHSESSDESQISHIIPEQTIDSSIETRIAEIEKYPDKFLKLNEQCDKIISELEIPIREAISKINEQIRFLRPQIEKYNESRPTRDKKQIPVELNSDDCINQIRTNVQSRSEFIKFINCYSLKPIEFDEFCNDVYRSDIRNCINDIFKLAGMSYEEFSNNRTNDINIIKKYDMSKLINISPDYYWYMKFYYNIFIINKYINIRIKSGILYNNLKSVTDLFELINEYELLNKEDAIAKFKSYIKHNNFYLIFDQTPKWYEQSISSSYNLFDIYCPYQKLIECLKPLRHIINTYDKSDYTYDYPIEFYYDQHSDSE